MVVQDRGAGVEGDRGTGLVVGEQDEGGGLGGCLEGFHGGGWEVVEFMMRKLVRDIVLVGGGADR